MLTLWAQADLLPADEFLLPAARPGGELRIDLPLAVLLRNPAVSQFAGIRRSGLIAAAGNLWRIHSFLSGSAFVPTYTDQWARP